MGQIAIVGSGLVGPVLAVYLARRGHRVDVYERQPDPRRRPPASGKSINLTLCERGFHALDRIGVGDRVRELALPAYGRCIHGDEAEPAFQPYGNRGEAIHSISRNELNQALLSFAEDHPDVAFHFGERCEGIDLETTSLRFYNPDTGRRREVRAERIFGADGVGSAVRRRLQRTDRFNFSQHYVEQGYKELSVPATPGGGWVLRHDAIHIWPRGRRMLIGFANRDGSFTMALHLPFEGECSFESIQTPEALSDLFARLFPTAVPLVPELLTEFFDHPTMSMVTVRCAPWTHAGKVALIGDAAHAIVPSYGQGANCGFEDCLVLAECLDRAAGDWHAAFAAYEALRKPDAETIADLAIEHFEELQVAVGDPRFLLRKRIERRINELYPDWYADLYSLISFTTLPYSEARRLFDERRRVVDRLLSLENAEAMLEDNDMDDMLHRAIGGVLCEEKQ